VTSASRSTSPLLRRLDAFRGTPLLVVGDLMVDRYIRGNVHRLSPEAPVPVVDVRHEEFMAGGAGNVAANIAALGGRPAVVSMVGQDAEGDILLSALRERGVDVDSVGKDGARPTIVKTRVLAGHQQVVRFDRESRTAMGRESTDLLLARIADRLPRVRGVVISDYGKGVITPKLLATVLRLARRRRIFVTVDPKVEHFLRYKGVDCITPNLKEAAEGMRVLPPRTDAEVDDLGARILRRLRARTVLVTRGERGMSLYRRRGETVHIPAQALEVFDVTGAGDTVIAAFSLSLAAGADFEEAARISNLAAGVVVAKLGTATAQPDEVRQAYAHWVEANPSVRRRRRAR
jgi:D-beta-D-heptose 7-phosphate kinase/D-beta-D-heptose 1-phosphate adenosyltransferase